ncbi:MAG: hypothetical protein AB8F94_11455 [Saprospiraceae bacterium]
MKNFKNLFFVIVLFSFFSCQEKERTFTEFNNLGKGSFPRLINPVIGVFNYDEFENSDSSFVEFVVEFYDEANGGMVESYGWDISYGDLEPVTIATKNKSDFVINQDGLPSVSFRFTYLEIFEALNLTINDIFPDKEFLMTATLKRADGKIFTTENTGSNIIGQPTFQGFFQYKPEIVNLPCFSLLEGSFNAKSISDSFDPLGLCNGNPWEGNVRWEAEEHTPNNFIGFYTLYSTHPTTQVESIDASIGGYYSCYSVDIPSSNLPLGDLRIKHECNILSFVGSSQWGEFYEFTKVEPNGATLKLRWQNNYGEAALVDLTRTDGEIWSEDLTCDGC